MSKPRCAGTEPIMKNLEPGVYHWCTCGESKTQPFCDGCHKGGEFTPFELVIEEKQDVALCTCKATKNAPFCDGTHQSLDSQGDT